MSVKLLNDRAPCSYSPFLVTSAPLLGTAAIGAPHRDAGRAPAPSQLSPGEALRRAEAVSMEERTGFHLSQRLALGGQLLQAAMMRPGSEASLVPQLTGLIRASKFTEAARALEAHTLSELQPGLAGAEASLPATAPLPLFQLPADALVGLLESDVEAAARQTRLARHLVEVVSDGDPGLRGTVIVEGLDVQARERPPRRLASERGPTGSRT